MSSETSLEDEFRILVATDNHLGYQEKHGERGDDSLITFEEILQLAVEKEADFILLGGDLFHENKPSRNCVIQCTQLLKKYCLGDRPVSFEYLSDPSVDFCMKEPMVNFHDPNINVSMPVFSIHGNHDDISGLGDTAALQLLSSTGLINYFGRWTDFRSVRLSPVLLQKGATRLALYGLGNIRDERLYNIFTDGNFVMLRPKEDTESWFNVFVLHQNRVKHSPKSYVPVEFLDDFLDLIIWGHEHENRLRPEWQEQQKFYISQPGSSVATSLCDGEAQPKAVGLLRVRGREFRMEPLPLRTVRPFVFRTLRLADCANLDLKPPDVSSAVEKYVAGYIENMLQEAEEQLTGHPKQPRLPLVRLRVEYSEEGQAFHAVRFGQQFTGRVAKPEEMVLLKRERREAAGRGDAVDGEVMAAVARQEEMRVEDFVAKYFSQLDEGAGLHLLDERRMARAVNYFVVKQDTSSVTRMVDHHIKKAVEELKTRTLLESTEEDIREELGRIREERKEQKLRRLNESASAGRAGATTSGEAAAELADSEEEEMREVLEDVSAPGPPAADVVTSSDSDDVMEVEGPPEESPARGGRGGRRAGGRTARNGRGRARAGAGDARPTSRGRGRGRAAASKGLVPITAAFAAAPRSSRAGSESSPTSVGSRAAAIPARRKGVVFDSDSD